MENNRNVILSFKLSLDTDCFACYCWTVLLYIYRNKYLFKRKMLKNCYLTPKTKQEEIIISKNQGLGWVKYSL